MDEKTGPSYFDVQYHHIHRRCKVRSDTPRGLRRVELEGGIRSKERRRNIRMSSEHGTKDQHGHPSERRR